MFLDIIHHPVLSQISLCSYLKTQSFGDTILYVLPEDGDRI
jgi:hypothetical protein